MSLVIKKRFSAVHNDILLSEGLISSWDVGKLGTRLKEIFTTKVEDIEAVNVLDGIFPAETSYGNVFTVSVLLKAPPTEEESEKLEKLLRLFGYANALSMSENKTYLRLEPLFSVDVSSLIPDNTILFHISPKKYTNKIAEIGLSPRFTETSSFHPGERIHLLYVRGDQKTKITALGAWRRVLASDKGLTPEMMSVWKVAKQQNTIYYHDDTVTIPVKGILGVFVKKNIPPSQISLLV